MKNIEEFKSHYIDSLLEAASNGELELVLTNELRGLLRTMDHTIAKKILESERKTGEHYKITLIGIDQSKENFNKFFVTQSSKVIDYFNKIGFTSKPDVISSSIQSNIPDELRTKFRSATSIGKVVNKLFPNEFKNAGDKGNDIESFVDAVKSERDKTFGTFKILEGDDVVKYYLKGSYESGGDGSTLYGSCMNKESCSPYIEFYEENNIKMIALMSVDEPDKIKGRAIIWDINILDGEELETPRVFMDRIYTIKSHDTEKFIEYAKNNKWLYKSIQNMSATVAICDPLIGECKSTNMISNNVSEGTAYPYMDTMKFLNADDNYITNDDDNGYEFNLESTHGGYTSRYGSEFVYMSRYGDVISTDELFWDDDTEEYVDFEDTVYSDYEGERKTQDYADENWTYSDIEDDYIPNVNIVHLSFGDDDAVSDDYANNNYYLCEYENEYYESDVDLIESDMYTYVPKDKAILVYLDKKHSISDYYYKNDGKYFAVNAGNNEIAYYDIKLKDVNINVINNLETGETIQMDMDLDKNSYFEYKGKYYINKLKDTVTGQLRIWEKKIQRFNGKY